jgi:hypothetical protein
MRVKENKAAARIRTQDAAPVAHNAIDLGYGD